MDMESLTVIEEDDERLFDDLSGKAEEDVSMLRECAKKERELTVEVRKMENEFQEEKAKQDSLLTDLSNFLKSMWSRSAATSKDSQETKHLERVQAEAEELERKTDQQLAAGKKKIESRKKALHEACSSARAWSSILRESKMTSLQRRAKKLATCEVVFVMDCTGSMSRLIAAAAKHCRSIIRSIQEEGGALRKEGTARVGAKVPLRVRFGFVAYRDYADGNLHLQHCDLTEDSAKVKTFIKSLVATGGEDIAEDVVGGLRVAAEDLSWSAMHRTVFLFADAPNHGRLLNEDCEDLYATSERTLQAEKDIPNIMKKFRSTKTNFVFVRMNDSTNKMETELRRFFEDGPETGAQFSAVDLKGDTEELLAAVQKLAIDSVSRSVTSSLTSTRRGHGLLTGPPPDVDPSPPHWPSDRCPVPEGWKMLEVELSFCFLRRHTEDPEWSMRKARLVQRIKPFSHGAMRAAYYFYDPEKKEKFVGKRYLGKGATPKDYESDIYMQHYAQCLAKDANERLSKANVHRAFSFLLPWKLKDPKSGLVFCMEYYMQGEYKKWNGNNGWLDDSVGGLMAAAFSHFSHAATAGQAMVVDIQGVNGWCFTDPQVHSTDRKAFGAGNLGESGMTRFYLTHQCNTYCQILGCEQEAEVLQPNQELREIDVTGQELKAFCAICGSDDVKITSKEMKEKAKRRHDIFCQAHFQTYQSSMVQKKCDECSEIISYSTWYTELRGKGPPELCQKCRARAQGLTFTSSSSTDGSPCRAGCRSTSLTSVPAPTTAKACPACKTPSKPGNKFCSECGQALGKLPSSAGASLFLSREAYLRSPEGSEALKAFCHAGKNPGGFKWRACRHWQSGTCHADRACGFVHNEFPV